MRVFLLAAASVLGCVVVAVPSMPAAIAQEQFRVEPVSWAALEPLRARLESNGITAASFDAYVDRVRRDNLRRVHEGDLDHLVAYLLQSTRFTSLPAIEPALSAKTLVDRLDPAGRERFLLSSDGAGPAVPADVRARMTAFVRAPRSSSRDARLAYFRELVRTAVPEPSRREAFLGREYLRVMRFVYQKEFVAQPAGGDAVADLYRARGLSTDTAVEAGYVVYTGLGIVRALDPDRRIRRVLIVGPGLDLAPRTGLLEAAPPESYQPWAVIDALLSLGLARAGDLQVVGADINPRVVEHLVRSHANPPVLTLISGVREGDGVALAPGYREYFNALGGAIGKVEAANPALAGLAPGHLARRVRVGEPAAAALGAVALDIVTGRLAAGGFDLVVATNILPYFDDVELMLAMSNIAAMLAPGGVFLHNESRPLLGELTAALGMPFEQSRHATIATVRGAPAPLFDSVWLHRKARQ